MTCGPFSYCRRIALGFAAAITLIAVTAEADNLDKRKLQVIGSWGNLSPWQHEKTFWLETLPEVSGGQLTANARPMDELGLSGFEMMRQLKLGAFDVVHSLAVYSASDIPVVSGIDLAGLVRDRDSYYKVVDAIRPVLEAEFERVYNAKIIAIYSFSSYSMFCNLPDSGGAEGLDVFKGLKVRSHSIPMGDFIEGLGATAVTLPFGEVVPAMQQGVVDCAVTGALAAYQAKWWQVTDSYLNIPLGFGTLVMAVNLDTWNDLSPETQAFIEAEASKLEAQINTAAAAEDTLGFSCYGHGPCSEGEPGNNEPIELSEADVAKVQGIVSGVVLARFAERCGPECTDTWNETVGVALGVKADR